MRTQPQAVLASLRWPSMQKPEEKCPEGATGLMAIYGEMAIYAVLPARLKPASPRLDDPTHLAAE
jgi:hypothetical protein